MKDKKHRYILEHPIKVEIGLLHPIKVGDYEVFEEISSVVSLDRIVLINHFKGVVLSEPQFKPLLDIVEELNMFDFIKFCGMDEYKDTFLSDLNKQYVELFKFCTKCNNDIVFYLIENDDEFQEYVKLIREMNGIPYEEASPNPEVERRNQLARKLESMRNENIDFESMFTSVCVGLQKTPSEVNDMSIYSFHKIFGRIGQFKSYDTDVLFATVSTSTDAKIDSWYKTDTVSKKESYITSEQLDRAKKSGELQSNL